MAAADTTMEARLAAIMVSLNESRRLLASSAQRLGVKEQEGKVATAASFATTTAPMLVQDRVREKSETKPVLSCLISTHRVMAAGALREEAVLAPPTPTRCSTLGSAGSVGNYHATVAVPTSGTAHIFATSLSSAGNSTLQGVGKAGMNMPAGCSAHVLTGPREGFVDGARAVNTEQPPNNSFPRFDGTNPSLWSEKCLEFFTKFNICQPFWTTAARMHMDGKAKEWFEAYRLRQVVGAWPEFIADVEAHFGVEDFPPATTILGAAHPSVDVHGSAEISLHTAVESTEPTATDCETVLTHIGGVSLFLEPSIDTAEVLFPEPHHMELKGEVFTIVRGLSMFLEIDIGLGEDVLYEDMMPDDDIGDSVLTNVGGISLLMELGLDSAADKSSAQPFKNMAHDDYLADTPLTHVCGMSLFRELMLAATQLWCRCAFIPEFEKHRHVKKKDAELCEQWDPGTHKDMIHELISLLKQAGGGLTITQRFEIEISSVTIRPHWNSVDYDCPVQFDGYLILGARCLVYALWWCTNQHTIQNIVQMGEGYLVILFLLLKNIFSCKNLCPLEHLARKFQCRPWNHVVHNQLVREAVRPKVAQHNELMIIACPSLAHAVCTSVLYRNHIGDYHRITILACNNHQGGLLVQKSEKWSYIFSNVEVTHFWSQARNHLVFSEVCSCWHLERRRIENFGRIRLIHMHKWLYNCCDYCSFIHLANLLQYKQWDPGI